MNDVQELVRHAERDGWTVERTSGGHLKFTHQDAATTVFGSATPSCVRSTRNTLADLRRSLEAREVKPRKQDATKPPRRRRRRQPVPATPREPIAQWPPRLRHDHHEDAVVGPALDAAAATLADVWPRL
jgi:predicted RNA binding protein YcfA (HicA-like mRNA interferase family)